MIKYFRDVRQGTETWAAMRCGLLTASEMKLILTPTLKIANNEKTRAHVFELAAQRVTKYVEPIYESFDMLRGKADEVDARILYNANYAGVEDVGFVTNDEWGFTIGYSPDGLIGDDGLIEAKSRCQKYQIETIVEYMALGKMPEEHVLQVQTGLLVTRRKWCDYISYCGGLEMATVRILPDPEIQNAIINAATAFEIQVADKVEKYRTIQKSKMRLIKTERRKEQEITL